MKKILKVPKMKQEGKYYCAPACLSMVMKYYDIDTKQEKLATEMNFREKQGVKLEDIVIAAKMYGFEASGERLSFDLNNSRNQIISMINNSRPLILLLRGKEYYEYLHAVVVKGYDKLTKFYLNNPGDLRKTALPFSEAVGCYTVSIKKLRKILDVPKMGQSYKYCAPACLSMVMKYYGIDVSQEKLAKEMNWVKERGVLPKDVIHTARKYGFKVSKHPFNSIEDITPLINCGVPPILVLPEINHSIVLKGYDIPNLKGYDIPNEKIYGNDPADFNEENLGDFFLNLPNNYLIVIKKK